MVRSVYLQSSLETTTNVITKLILFIIILTIYNDIILLSSIMYNNRRFNKHRQMAYVSRVSQLDNNRDRNRITSFNRPNRGGIIMYTVYNGVLYFGLAVDAETHDLTDAGGAIDYNIDKTAVRGCVREFIEETLNIFETVTEEHLQSCPVVYDEKNMIIFMHIAVDPNEVSRKLLENYKEIIKERSKLSRLRTKKCPSLPEVCGITWLTKESFKDSLERPGIMYSRVRKFLSRCSLEDLYRYL